MFFEARDAQRCSESMFGVTSRRAVPNSFIFAFLSVAACYENATTVVTGL